MSGKKRIGSPSRKPRKRARTAPSKPGPGLPRSGGRGSDISSILDKANRLFHQKKLDQVVALLQNFDESLLRASSHEHLNYYRLLSFSLTNTGRLAEAETAAQRALELADTDRDFHFVLAYVAANYKDYDKCLECTHRFLELYDRQDEVSDGKEYLSDGHLYLAYNYLGVAYKAKEDFPKAEKAFLKVIELKPSYEHAYLNLASLYQNMNEYSKAERIVEKGLKKCSQVQELRMIKKTLENKATICACMIVKDEEELLPGCLESIRSWIDDIIIVDTGSTDRTVEIARSYGAKVYFQEWEGNFSKARNYSLSKATCDWIFVIDADEEFVQEDLPILRGAVNQDKYRIISVNVYNMDKETGEYSSFLPSSRFFRRDAGFCYDGIVHNQLRSDEDEVILRMGVRIKHFGYNLPPEKMKKKLARSRELLEKQLEEDPDNPFVHFNYAQLLRGTTVTADDELCDLILRHAIRAVELSNTDIKGTLAIHLQGLHQQVTTLIIQRKYEEAEKICLRALQLKPDYLDAIVSLGHIYGGMKKLDKAEEHFKKYLEEQEKYDPSKETLNVILLHVRSRHVGYYGIAMIKQYQKDFAGAEEYFLKTLEELDPFKDAHLRLANIYLDRKDMEKALIHIDKELIWKPDSDLANLYKARYFGMKNEDIEAEKFLNKAVELTEDNPEVLERAGVFWADRHQFNKAVHVLEKLIRLQPTYEHGLWLLAKAYYDSADFENSLAIYERYLEINSDNANAINDMANCYFKLGDYENAEKIFSKALRVDDNMAVTYRNLGLTKLHLGKPKEALPLLENYISISPDDFDIELAIGSIYSQSARYTEAIPHFERYLTANPGSLEGLFSISECYYHLGYVDSAAIGYRQILRQKPDFQPSRDRLNEIETSKTTT